MDAAQTNLKKTAFLLATALLLTAPFHAAAQATVNASSTSVVIGSSSCNDFQNITITSSTGSSLAFSVYIQYAAGNPYSNWLYTDVAGSGSTSTATPFSANTGANGVTLTVGLNLEIAAATPQATIVLTPAGGGAQTNITVFYTQNTSCGGNTGSTSNGFFTVTPGNVALTAATNGEQSQTVTIQNTTGSGFTFQFVVSPANSWLSASAATLTLSADGTASLNVTANASLTAGVGTYNGILTIESAQTGFGSPLNIPVVFTVTSGTTTGTGGGGGGTLTVGTAATSNTDVVNFSYVSPTAPSDQCIPIQDTSTGANYYQAVVTTQNGGNWLYANHSLSGTTTGLLAPGSNACVDLSLTNVLSTLPSGAYQGSVALTSSSGATATINVNLYVSAGAAPGVTVSPSAIYVFPNVAPNSSVVQEEVFSLSAATGYVLGTASLSSSAGGFSMSTPVANNNTETFTITSNSTGLTTGVYATTVTMTSTLNGSTNTTTLTIVLPVGQSGTALTGTGGNTNSVVAPLSLAFQQQAGNSFWDGGKEAQALTITGQSGTQWSATIVYGSGANWLNFDSPIGGTGTFGSTPATLMVDIFNGVTNLTPSTTPYQATINVTTTTGTTTVTVTLLVTPANTPVLLGIPASATFSATSGTSTPTQSITVAGSDNPNSLTSPPISAGTPTQTWVTANTSGNTLNLNVSAGSLATGVYSATIPVSASAYSNPIQYPIVLVVNGGGEGIGTGGLPLTLSPTSLTFNGVTSQVSQNLSVSATTTTTYSAVSSEISCTGTSWLQVSPSGGSLSTNVNPTIAVTVNPAGIVTGTTCTGLITLGTSGGSQTVNVTMVVGNSSTGGGNVTVSPTSMTFAYTQNQTVPAAQTATIVNQQTGTASISFTVQTQETVGTSVNWLQTSVSSASTPYNSPGLSVSVAPGSLSPGTYNGTVVITPTGGTAVSIAVTLTITGVPVVSATVSGGGTNINLSYMVGQTSPTATINVSGGGSSAAFTAVAASSNGFLQVSPTSGTTPNTGTFNLNVSVVPTVLSTLLPSTTPYTGTVTITGTSPATGTTIVNVSLTVTAPLPVITGVTNAASGATGAVSPGELISIFGNPANPIGPATSVQLNSTTCPGTCTQVPLSMGGVQVKFLPAGVFAPLIFVNQGQINAVVPYTVAGQAALSVEVLYLGQTSNAFPLSLTPTAPGIFTSNSSGTGQAAVGVYDNLGNYQPNGNNPSFPAKAGWTLVLYVTGEGNVSPQPVSGAVTVYNALANPPVPVPLVKPNVTIGTQPATVTFYGEAPGLVSGVLQINVLVPAGAGTGPVQLFLSLGTASSQAGVTVYLQ